MITHGKLHRGDNVAKYFRRFSLALALAACISSAQTPGTGRIKIKPLQSYSGGPLSKPTAIVVYNFAATADEVKLNKAVLNRARMAMSGAAGDEKTKLAHKIVDDFSQSLIKDLEKKGLPVSRGVAGEPAPENSLAIQGDFLLIDEGNRARRMAIGLGAGSSKVEAHVECYLTQPDRNLIINEFQAISQSSRRPGAAETMGAGAAPAAAAAVSGAGQFKQGSAGDTDRMAKAIAKEITKTLIAQGWLVTKSK
jgi:hypothetical protein